MLHLNGHKNVSCATRAYGRLCKIRASLRTVAWATRRFWELGRGHPPLFQSHKFLDWFCDGFCVYLLPLGTVRRFEPSGQAHGSFAGIATSTANGHVVFFFKRSVVIEVLYGCFRGAPQTRGLLHPNTAVYASPVSRSNLSLVLVRNTVCVGHGGTAARLGRRTSRRRCQESPRFHEFCESTRK
jgi:hypothetical protein